MPSAGRSPVLTCPHLSTCSDFSSPVPTCPHLHPARFADDGANFSINSDDPMVTGTWTQQVTLPRLGSAKQTVLPSWLDLVVMVSPGVRAGAVLGAGGGTTRQIQHQRHQGHSRLLASWLFRRFMIKRLTVEHLQASFLPAEEKEVMVKRLYAAYGVDTN